MNAKGVSQELDGDGRQTIEDELRTEKNLLEELLQTMQEGASFHKLLYDKSDKAVDYVITNVNPAYEQITGLQRDIAVGRKASDLYGTGLPPYLEIYAGVAETGKSTSFEAFFEPMHKFFKISVFSPKKGTFVTIFSDLTIKIQEDEELRRYREHLEELITERTRQLRETNQSLAVEVASRKQAEEAAIAQRQLFIEVLDTLPCYLVLLTPDYHVPFANRFFRDRFGESHGKRCFDYLFNRTKPCEVCETFKVLDTMQPLRWEWEGPDGHNYDIYDFPFHDVDGSTLIMEAGIDVTEQKKSQAALQTARTELEKRVEARTMELHHKTEELERSNRDLEAFAFAASHDLQEPLRMVTSFAELLATRYVGKLDADADKFIKQVTAGASRMRTMIGDLLQFSRIQSKGAPFGEVDLNLALKDAMANLEIAIKESAAQVFVDPLPLVRGDVTQMTQLFQNLIGNAIKYRKVSDPPLIYIGVIPPTPGNAVHVFVKDNGIGIDARHFEKIFQPFHRLHAWGRYSGTGIGLAICKRIVERHGGKIWVESAPAVGSTFHFTLGA